MPWFRAKLQAWREEKAAVVCRNCRLGVESSIVMSDEYLEATARFGTHIQEISDLRRWAGSWSDIDRYRTEVVAILNEGRTLSTHGSEITELWRANCAKKRARRQGGHNDVDSIPSQAESLSQRKEAWLIANGIKPQGQVAGRKGRRTSPKPTAARATNTRSTPSTATPNVGRSSQASLSQGGTGTSFDSQASSSQGGTGTSFDSQASSSQGGTGTSFDSQASSSQGGTGTSFDSQVSSSQGGTETRFDVDRNGMGTLHKYTQESNREADAGQLNHLQQDPSIHSGLRRIAKPRNQKPHNRQPLADKDVNAGSSSEHSTNDVSFSRSGRKRLKSSKLRE